MSTSEGKLSVKEKIGYSLGDLAANLIFQTLVTYLAYYYTDIYGLSAGKASAIMFTVGMIAAFGFNPIIGALADRTSTKWGEIPAMDIMDFSAPGNSFSFSVYKILRFCQCCICSYNLCTAFIFVCRK